MLVLDVWIKCSNCFGHESWHVESPTLAALVTSQACGITCRLMRLPFVAVAAAALLVYVGSYQVSFGPIIWLMVSEIFPLLTRGRGISLAVLSNFGSNAIVTFAFSPLKELLGAENLFLVFGAIALLSLIFVIKLVPETKGLSLEDIESKILK